MTTTDEFTDLLAAAQQDKRDQASASLARIVELEAQKKALEQELNVLRGRVKEVLEDDPMPLVDGEHGISAVLKERKSPASIDLISLARHPEHERHLVAAAQMGLLTAALTPLRLQKGKSPAADVLLSYEMPAGITNVLTIEVVP